MPSPTRKRPFILTRATADKHVLYQVAVQNPVAEIDFVTRVFRDLARRPLRRLREDFCGTAWSACEFARRHEDNRVVGVDLHAATLAWARRHNLAALEPQARARVTLLRKDARNPGPRAMKMDAVGAMNFSYFVFTTRPALRDYFASVRRSLVPGGVFFLDIYGGSEATKIMQERRRCHHRGSAFRYVWDQSRFDHATNRITCKIHFEFDSGPALTTAFTYHWRAWSVPEVRELLAEAGFKRSILYWEGDDGKGGGNGIFRPIKIADEDCLSFVAYIAAQK